MSMANPKAAFMVQMPTLKTIRFVAFAILFFFSLIVLSITSSLTQTNYSGASQYGLGIGTSLFTILATVIVLGLEAYAKPMWTSWTAIELSWLFLMVAFWAAIGGLASNDSNYTCNGLCFRYFTGGGYCTNTSYTVCQEFQVVAAFSWMNFVIIVGLFAWTLTVAIVASKRGDKFIWKSPAHSYETHAIYLDAPSPAFNSNPSLAKGKIVDLERARTPSPTPSI
ncbi:hypothetical protein CALVIDRAFT_561275 [Calocera viscosa TUFC12733]|uniref:MARVEL domain-containing protein n=1 Tax=Calocera viscosa (strain TUFC12733) TaxID=1330018 RepID=A0A167Q4X9_CALVF|nr:hypothetical protein CALVIDRAFT_561275 [Calocera viscosa TUFC12733]